METATANDAYRAARLKTLDRLLRVHGARHLRHRGHQGSINHLVEILDEAIAFLGGEAAR